MHLDNDYIQKLNRSEDNTYVTQSVTDNTQKMSEYIVNTNADSPHQYKINQNTDYTQMVMHSTIAPVSFPNASYQAVTPVYAIVPTINTVTSMSYPATEITAIVSYQYPSKSEETAKKERKIAYRKQKMDSWRFLMAAAVIGSIFLHFMRLGSGVNLISHLNNFLISPVAASTQPVTSKLVEGAKTPDWSQKNFRDMKFSEPGSVDFPNIKNPGMKERRSWSTGQSLAQSRWH